MPVKLSRIIRRIPVLICVQLGGEGHTVFPLGADGHAAEGYSGIADVNYQNHIDFPYMEGSPRHAVGGWGYYNGVFVHWQYPVENSGAI